MVKPVFSLHPKAPLFTKDINANFELFREAVISITSAEGTPKASDIELWRQTGLVNLWFFLKYILGFAGPYERLNADLHLEMCNERQAALAPGSKFGFCLPRSSYKSTINTHGAATWELVRNPELCIGFAGCTFERASEFMHQCQRNFDSNDLFALLYPEHAIKPKTRGERWNDSEGVLPSRIRSRVEPNMKCIAVGASTAGNHFDLLAADDIVGDAQLNSDRGSSIEMHKIKQWFRSNIKTLLMDKKSRVSLSFTRYAPDDAYDWIMAGAKEHLGNWQELEDVLPVDPEGEWVVYYRQAIEDGVSILPGTYSVEEMDRMRRDDPWTWATQYMNNPIKAGTAEFTHLVVDTFTVDWTDESAGPVIVRNFSGIEQRIPVYECDLLQAIDPAASSKMMGAKTSRSACIVLARDWRDNYYILDLKAGYVPATTFIDWLFGFFAKYRLRASIVETQGPFKVLIDVIRKEQEKRGTYIHFKNVSALSDKDAGIRSTLEPIAARGKLFIHEAFYKTFMQEFSTFPTGNLKDILDATKLAIVHSVRPPKPEDEYDEDDDDAPFNDRPLQVLSSGYPI